MKKSLYEEIYQLKKIVRKAWDVRNIPDRRESDAEHSFSMIILALELMKKNDLHVDPLKVVKMIAYHEICEIDAGDITPFDGISNEEKFKREYAGVKRVAKQCKMPEIEEIWLEFEKNETPEAQFVNMLDKCDLMLQAQVYADDYNNPDFFSNFSEQMLAKFEEFKKLKR